MFHISNTKFTIQLRKTLLPAKKFRSVTNNSPRRSSQQRVRPPSPNLPFPIGFPMVKQDRSHRFPVRLAPPLGLDKVVLNRFFSSAGYADVR